MISTLQLDVITRSESIRNHGKINRNGLWILNLYTEFQLVICNNSNHQKLIRIRLLRYTQNPMYLQYIKNKIFRIFVLCRVGQTISSYCCILTFDPAKHAIPKWCTGRKWHIPMARNRKKSRRRIWLTKWDKVKAHDTLIDWCTGRDWHLNGMTVISGWWQSNMPFQRLSGRLSGRLNYYVTRWGQEVSALEIRWVGDKIW